VHSVFGKVVGGLDVLSKMEAVDVDKKDRPKVSIKIEDSLVFVDPYKEIDEQVSIVLNSIKEKTVKTEEKSETKTGFEALKEQRAGVGKYLNAAIL